MKQLLIMRHAKSSWKDESLTDHERPLNKRGKRDAPRMGRFLSQMGLVPDLIVSSTARRAMDTAAATADENGYERPIMISRYLYHGDPEDYVALLRSLDEEPNVVMVVGHNPGLEVLVEVLGGRHERLPTAAIVTLSLEIDRWRDLSLATKGRLEQVWRPKELSQP